MFSSPDPSVTILRPSSSSSIIFHILIKSIGAKLGRNVLWMVLYRDYVFGWSEIQKRNKRPKGVKKDVSIYGVIYTWIQFIYCSFVFDENFFNAFIKKTPFHKHAYRYYYATINILTYWWSQRGVNELFKFSSNFNVDICKMFIFMSY